MGGEIDWVDEKTTVRLDTDNVDSGDSNFSNSFCSNTSCSNSNSMHHPPLRIDMHTFPMYQSEHVITQIEPSKFKSKAFTTNFTAEGSTAESTPSLLDAEQIEQEQHIQEEHEVATLKTLEEEYQELDQFFSTPMPSLTVSAQPTISPNSKVTTKVEIEEAPSREADQQPEKTEVPFETRALALTVERLQLEVKTKQQELEKAVKQVAEAVSLAEHKDARMQQLEDQLRKYEEQQSQAKALQLQLLDHIEQLIQEKDALKTQVEQLQTPLVVDTISRPVDTSLESEQGTNQYLNQQHAQQSPQVLPSEIPMDLSTSPLPQSPPATTFNGKISPNLKVDVPSVIPGTNKQSMNKGKNGGVNTPHQQQNFGGTYPQYANQQQGASSGPYYNMYPTAFYPPQNYSNAYMLSNSNSSGGGGRLPHSPNTIVQNNCMYYPTTFSPYLRK